MHYTNSKEHMHIQKKDRNTLPHFNLYCFFENAISSKDSTAGDDPGTQDLSTYVIIYWIKVLLVNQMEIH